MYLKNAIKQEVRTVPRFGSDKSIKKSSRILKKGKEYITIEKDYENKEISIFKR